MKGNREKLKSIEELCNKIEEIYAKDSGKFQKGIVSFKKRGNKYIPYHVYKENDKWKYVSLGSKEDKTQKLIDDLVYKQVLTTLNEWATKNKRILKKAQKYNEITADSIIENTCAKYRMPDKVKTLINLVSGLPNDDYKRRAMSGTVINVRRCESGNIEEIFVRAGYDMDMVVRWFEEGGHQGKEISNSTRRIDTGLGFYVRSKSELLIAFALTQAGIPFKYELKTWVGGIAFYPDFTILMPDGSTLIWEHFGLMGIREYEDNARGKMMKYLDAGYYPNQKFFATYEDGENELDGKAINNILKFIENVIRTEN